MGRKQRPSRMTSLFKDKRYKRGIRVGYPLKTERNYAPIRTDPPHSGPRAGGATAPILRVRDALIVILIVVEIVVGLFRH